MTSPTMLTRIEPERPAVATLRPQSRPKRARGLQRDGAFKSITSVDLPTTLSAIATMCVAARCFADLGARAIRAVAAMTEAWYR
jgi:hypothetical protein